MDRDAVFNGFNTPLLPDILICTQVGQEGIDLHRHCRHVIHYDLGWNPATLEQRTEERIESEVRPSRTSLALDQVRLQGVEPEEKDSRGWILHYHIWLERMTNACSIDSEVVPKHSKSSPAVKQRSTREGESSWLDPDDFGRSTDGTETMYHYQPKCWMH